MSGLFHVPYPLFFLKGYLATLPVSYANLPCDITVYQGLLLLKLPGYWSNFVSHVPRAHNIQLTISTRLPSVCYVPPNIRTNYRHLTVFTLKNGYARNVCDFSEDEPLTFFYVIIL